MEEEDWKCAIEREYVVDHRPQKRVQISTNVHTVTCKHKHKGGLIILVTWPLALAGLYLSLAGRLGHFFFQSVIGIVRAMLMTKVAILIFYLDVFPNQNEICL